MQMKWAHKLSVLCLLAGLVLLAGCGNQAPAYASGGYTGTQLDSDHDTDANGTTGDYDHDGI